MAGFAWVTLATNDSYSLGALVLANSLRQVGTSHQLAVLVTPGVTNSMREQLRSIFNVVVEVNILDSKDEANLRLLQRPELGVTFTKLHCWRLTQFEKCVFLDADTLVLQNADELFEREELSAAPDVGWPDCFNSGVFVYRPSNETYENLVKFALERGSFDGGDQGLLNLYFSDWAHKDISKHLPFIYNTCSTACYSYLPAFKQFGAGIKIIHFIGSAKPWLQYFDTESRQVQPSSGLEHLQPVLQRWWDLFFSFIQPKLSSDMARSKSPVVHNPQPYPQPFYTSFIPLVTNTIAENENDPESDYKNVWDPWDEYEQKIVLTSSEFVDNSAQLIVESKSITNIDSGSHESQNTNAHSVLQPFPTQNITPIIFPSNQSQTTNNNYIEIVETKSFLPLPETPQSPSGPKLPPSPLPPTPPPPQLKTVYVPTENQYSHISNPSNDFPPRIPTPPPEQSPSNYKPYAQPHEFEPPCTVANESILHPNDNGLHDSDIDAGLAGAFSQLKLGEPRSPGQLALEDHLRRQGWEVGNIDYLGKDSFENIWKKICQTIDAAPITKESTPPPATESSPVPSSAVTETVPKESPKSQEQEKLENIVAPAPAGAPLESSAAAPTETQALSTTTPTAQAPSTVTPEPQKPPSVVAPEAQATPAVQAPVIVAPETQVPPSAAATEAQTPLSIEAQPTPAAAPETQAPSSVVAPEAQEPLTVVPETQAVPAAASEVQTPPAAIPEAQALPTATSEAQVQPTAAPEVQAPLTAAPEAETQPTAAPEAQAQTTAAPEAQAQSTAPPTTQEPPAAAPTTQVPPAVAPEAQLLSTAPSEQAQLALAPIPSEQSQTPPAAAVEESQAPEQLQVSSPEAQPAAKIEQQVPPAPAPEAQIPPTAEPEAQKPPTSASEAPVTAATEQAQPQQQSQVSSAVSETSTKSTPIAASVPSVEPPIEAAVDAPPEKPQVPPAEPQPATVAAQTPSAAAPASPTAESAKPKTKEGTKKPEAKPAATVSSETTNPTPPPRKAASNPKKPKAKK